MQFGTGCVFGRIARFLFFSCAYIIPRCLKIGSLFSKKQDLSKIFNKLNPHLIIELKKGDRTVKSQEITAQVYKYFSATKKIMATLDQPEPFEIIVLLGRHLDGENYDEDVYQATKNALKAYHCRIMYYDELLKNAQNLYSDFLEQNKNLSTLSNIINELELD